MLAELVRSIGAALIGIVAFVHLRVAFDLLRNGPDEIARRRNPANYRDRLVGMSVGPHGMRYKTRRVYVGYPGRG